MTDVDVSGYLPTTPRAVQLRVLAAMAMGAVGVLCIIGDFFIDMDVLTHSLDTIPFLFFLLPGPLAGIALTIFAFLALQRKALDMARGLSVFLGGIWWLDGMYLVAARKYNPAHVGMALAGFSLLVAFLMLRKVAAIEKACRDERRAEIQNLDIDEPDFHMIDEPEPADLPIPADEVDLDQP